MREQLAKDILDATKECTQFIIGQAKLIPDDVPSEGKFTGLIMAILGRHLKEMVNKNIYDKEKTFFMICKVLSSSLDLDTKNIENILDKLKDKLNERD